ncbi:MAG: hypothetical protein ABIP71_09905 [Verrucomicrobiota bacterium]
MNLPIFALIALLFLFGCSKESESGKPKRVGRSYVPTNAAEVAASRDFKLEHSTKSGIQYYVCPLQQEIVKSISFDSPDYTYLIPASNPFFLVPVRNGQIVDLNTAEAAEMAEYVAKRGKK